MPTDLRKRAGSYSRQSRASTKSIHDQATANRSAADENDWRIVAEYADGVSASRFAKQARDDWPRVVEDIESGTLEVLILWESSRGDRTPETWFALLATCRDKGVLIHVVTHRRTYDMTNPRDWRTLAEDGVDNAYESEKISLRVRRGHASAAAAGRPSHGRTPYGYRRVYDSRTGALVGQAPDPETAPVVREIIAKAARGVPISRIAADLNDAGVPAVSGTWYRMRVRDIAVNPAYAGIRIYNGESFPAAWPPLVDPDLFWTAQRVLLDPARLTSRPGRQKHLLSYLATCGPCGGPLCSTGRGRYKCLQNSCVTIVQAPTDELVARLLKARLSRPDAYTWVRKAGADSDQAVTQARAEVKRLRTRLDEWRLSAARNDTSPASLAVIEADLTAQIRVAERRADHAAVPPALRQILEPGADVGVRWDDAPVPARRDVIRAVAEIRVDQADVPGGRLFDPRRLGRSRWLRDGQTWGDLLVTPYPPDPATI